MTIELRKISEEFSVSGQVFEEDLEHIKKSGFKSIIINRPDNEKPGQPLASELAVQIDQIGLTNAFIPMAPGHLTKELLEQMRSAFTQLPKPILAYCASGTRSTILWCCVNVEDLGVEAVLSRASEAGYELEQIRPLLDSLTA